VWSTKKNSQEACKTGHALNLPSESTRLLLVYYLGSTSTSTNKEERLHAEEPERLCFVDMMRSETGLVSFSILCVFFLLSAQTAAQGSYSILSASSIKTRLLKLAKVYPKLVRVSTAQKEFGLKAAGSSSDCRFDPGQGCRNYFLTIQDFVAHPPNSSSSKQLPEVLLSGALHGDERVGPTAVVETASLLLFAAACERKPASRKASCQSRLNSMGLSPQDRRWLARLVTTRRIVIVPTANALGYFRKSRYEGNVDVNRDFPFDLKSSACMQSIGARTLNELFRRHMFQLALTFHGGMEGTIHTCASSSV